MLRVVRVAIPAILAAVLAPSLLFAESDEARMKGSYRVAPDGTFMIEPGVTAKAAFDKRGNTCALTFFGDMSEEKVIKTFNALVPAEERGSTNPANMITCVGLCIQGISYKNVHLVTGSFGKSRSDPAAIITFTRSECKTAAAEANKQFLHIHH